MKILKFITIFTLLVLFNSTAFAEEKKRDCSEIKSSTLMSMIDKMRCKQGKGKMNLSLDGIKNVFKKKN